MGKRGPKPKPTFLRVLEGNPSRRPLNDAEPTIDDLPRMPPAVALDDVAAVEFDRIIGVMPRGVYTAGDVAVLAEYALAYAASHRAMGDIAKHGQLILEPILDKQGLLVGHKYRENPAMRSWRAAHAALMATTDRLGLSPGQRSRLKVPQTTERKSKFGDLIA